MKIRNVVLLLIAIIAMTSNSLTPAFSQAAETDAHDGQTPARRVGEETSAAPVVDMVDDAVVDEVDAITAEKLPEGVFVVRVYYNTAEDSQLLTSFDLFEYNNQEEKYFLVAVDRAGLARLRSLGFRAEIDPQETANYARLFTPLAQQGEWLGIDALGIDTIPDYPCYRTVEETYQTALDIVAAHPTLATWIDAGDSWEKATVTSPEQAGYDMIVLKLTNSAITGDKPKLFITASIHAREYTPAETVTRFAEYLVNNYGVDADATWILDHHEIHLMFHANPDGRKKAEAGTDWRKNTDRDDGCTTTYGSDLNRNFTYQWDTGGSSDFPCDTTYHGPTAGSEPETQGIQNYLKEIFPDQRGTEAAPTDATGIYIDMHSSGGYVMWPWAYSRTATPPNSTQLRTLGRKFAYFNGYRPGQVAAILYVASGGGIDYSYGELGVASFAFELGTAFFQDCSTFTGTIYPNNLPALIYAAKVARTPYLTPLGPDTLNLALPAASIYLSDRPTLTATINDTRYRQTNGTEPTQTIAAAEYYIDTPPWLGGTAYPMAASDGSFDSTTEGVTASVDTAGLTEGQHILFVRGQDANGNWGAFSAIFLNAMPTSVELKSFTAAATENAIAVRWETTSEVDNLGFNLYRATAVDGPKTKLNDELIATLVPPGSSLGAAYRYDDMAVTAGLRYLYWLEQVDIYGGTNLYGPASALAGLARWVYLPAIVQVDEVAPVGPYEAGQTRQMPAKNIR